MRNREPLAHLEKACNKEQTMEDHLQASLNLLESSLKSSVMETGPNRQASARPGKI